MNPIAIREIGKSLSSVYFPYHSFEIWLEDRIWFELSVPFRVYAYADTNFTDRDIKVEFTLQEPLI